MLSRFLQDTYTFRELPAVIGGDFNAFPDSEPTRLLLEQGLIDAALQVDPPADGPTSWFRDITDPADSARARIDYLFLYSEGAQKPVHRPALLPVSGSALPLAPGHPLRLAVE